MKLVAMVTIGFLGALRRKASHEEAKVIYHPYDDELWLGSRAALGQ